MSHNQRWIELYKLGYRPNAVGRHVVMFNGAQIDKKTGERRARAVNVCSFCDKTGSFAIHEKQAKDAAKWLSDVIATQIKQEVGK